MKKLLWILILTTGWLVSSGQLHKPVQPLNENGYTLKQFEAFALNPTEYSASYREKLLSIVNHFLEETGLYKNYNNGNPLNEAWISWIFYPGRTSTEWRIYPDGFRNTYQSYDGRSVEWFWDKRRFEGLVTTLHLEGYELDLGKTVCTNLVDVPYKTTVHQTPPKVNLTPEPRPDPTPDWRTYQAPKKVYFNPPPMPVVPIVVFKQKTWVGRNIIPIVAAFVATSATIYVVANHHHDVASPIIEPRTMPPGIPSVPVIPNPGVPSDPRTMPPGTGFVPHTNFGGGGITIFRF